MQKTCKVTLAHVSDPAWYGNPLALACLKTYADSVMGKAAAIALKEYGIAPSIKDPGRVAADILSDRPAIVGFSCYIWNVMAVISVCLEVKKRSPSTLIVLGGSDASARGASILKDSLADIVVRGEGELTFAELLSRFIEGKPWAGTPGTVSFSGGREVQGPPRPYIKNLDIIPSPYLAGLFNGKKYRYFVCETSRGCPFKCAYCIWANGGGVRNFSLERAGKDLDWVGAHTRSCGTTDLNEDLANGFISDQDLLSQGERGRKILRRIRSGSDGKRISWVVATDLRYWDKRTARAANHDIFCFGLSIQSIDSRVVRLSGREPLPLAELEKRVDLLSRYATRPRIWLQLMLGMPGDSREGFLKTLHWALKACERIQPAGAERLLRTRVGIYHTAVFPNTELERGTARFGVKWSRRPPYLIKSMKGFTNKDFKRCYDEMRRLQNSEELKKNGPRLILGVHGRVI